MKSKKLNKVFPKIVNVMLMIAPSSFVIGTYADPDSKEDKDIDIAVTLSEWFTLAPFIPKDASPNSFGGWKFNTDEGIEVDIWPEDIGKLMTTPNVKYMYNLRQDLLYKSL